MGCTVGWHPKEAIILTRTSDRCPVACLYIFLIPRPLPNDLLKKANQNILKYAFLVQARQDYLFSLVNSDLLYLDVHKVSSSNHRATKDHFQCISLLTNRVCRLVIICPLPFDP